MDPVLGEENSGPGGECEEDIFPKNLMIGVYVIYSGTLLLGLCLAAATAIKARITREKILTEYQHHTELQEDYYEDDEYLEGLEAMYDVIPQEYRPRGSITNSQEDEDGEEEDEEEEEGREGREDRLSSIREEEEEERSENSDNNFHRSSSYSDGSDHTPTPVRQSSVEYLTVDQTYHRASGSLPNTVYDFRNSLTVKSKLSRSSSGARADFLIRVLSNPDEFKEFPESPEMEKRSPTGRKISVSPYLDKRARNSSSLLYSRSHSQDVESQLDRLYQYRSDQHRLSEAAVPGPGERSRQSSTVLMTGRDTMSRGRRAGLALPDLKDLAADMV